MRPYHIILPGIRTVRVTEASIYLLPSNPRIWSGWRAVASAQLSLN